jgi:hypothetical protein
MNHVPDAVLAAIDEFGWTLLTDDPTVREERLRSDLRVRIACDRDALDAGAAPITFGLEHTTAMTTLREHGSYVCTVVDNVESRLRSWGIDPPRAYTHRRTDEGWQVYGGTVEF